MLTAVLKTTYAQVVAVGTNDVHSIIGLGENTLGIVSCPWAGFIVRVPAFWDFTVKEETYGRPVVDKGVVLGATKADVNIPRSKKFPCQKLYFTHSSRCCCPQSLHPGHPQKHISSTTNQTGRK